MPLIYIILINYNGHIDTIECIKNLEDINYSNYKIIVVDNKSSDNSLNILEKFKDKIILIESKENLGFSGGNNIGIKYAIENKGDYVLLLNNDTLVEPNFLNELLNCFKKYDNVGAVIPKINYYPDQNRIWYGGGSINWNKFIVEHFGMNKLDNGICNVEQEVDFATGCCMLISKSVINQLGGLSEEYFMYYEDADYCVKIKENGYKIIYNPLSLIYHKLSVSTGGANSPFAIEWNTRNRIIFMNKFKKKVSKIKWYKANIFFYSTRIIVLLRYLILGKISSAKALLIGIKQGITYKV